MNETNLKAVLRAFVHDLTGTMGANAAFFRIIKEEYADILDERGLKWLDLMGNDFELTHIKLQRLALYTQLIDYRLHIEECQLTDVLNHSQHLYVDKLTVHFEGSLSIIVCKELLGLFFVELMSNTVKHATSKHELTAYIHYYETNQQHHFMYCDNGTSVTKDILEYVLQPLKKLSDGHNDLSSAGLGFSIMSRIAELLSGSLTITATPTGLERESYWSDIENATGLQVILSIPVEPQQTHIELE